MNKYNSRKTVVEIFQSALKAVDPYDAVKEKIPYIQSIFQKGQYNKFLLISFGKAAYPMAVAVEEIFGKKITDGIIITKYGHSIKEKNTTLKFYEGGHPVPDEQGMTATQEVLQLVKDVDSKTFILCLVSGGGSSLFVSPGDGLTLEDKKKTTELLMKAGADIYELNAVRKHLSKVKGGRFAEIVYPAKLVSLIISDVMGDKLDVIASGATSDDESTFIDALSVLNKYKIDSKVPRAVMDFLTKGKDGLIKETPKNGSPVFQNVENIIIGSNKIALDGAIKKAEELGFDTKLLSSELKGKAKDAAHWLVQEALAQKKKNTCLIAGGETTVVVKGNGKGGRNMELALTFALEIENHEGLTFLSAGTDGTDGPTDAAGAIVDGLTVKKARTIGLQPEKFLDDNDSYTFFSKTGELYITGPTKTNVMDIQVILWT